MPMRLAIAGIATESCTFSPVNTTLEDFRILRGDDLLRRYAFMQDKPVLPLILARALPGGPVTPEAYEGIKEEFLGRLREAAPLDGLFLDMHGAMNVVGMDDAEGDWMRAARQVVGPQCLISASYDLHGNVSRQVVDNIDILTAFRHAPHTDAEETRKRAFGLLERSLREGLRPQRAWLAVPVALPGEKTSTEWEPGATLYARLRHTDRIPGVLDASLLVGYVWADEPRAMASVVVVGTDMEVLEREARALAMHYWNAREQFRFGAPAGSIDDCITWALEEPATGIFVCDSGDNPTAGGVGDTSFFLERLLKRRVEDAILGGIADAEATDACYRAGVGARLELALGGKLNPTGSQPLPVRGRVLHLHPGANDRQAVLQVDGVKVVVSSKRRPYHYVDDFHRLGLDPSEHKMVVVKMGYLVPDLKRIASRILLALSPGVVDQAIERLPFERIRRPIYPLDPDMAWQPG
ncbi:MAG TPA: M81 family metallopeptidase [Chthonomonadales bacterium]|nr:M81 family metallopeptidase [Chthonomonadales bacterium]